MSSDDEIVYIGSAYGQTIKDRLMQYTRPCDSGNTLEKTIAKEIKNKIKVEYSNNLEAMKKRWKQLKHILLEQ